MEDALYYVWYSLALGSHFMLPADMVRDPLTVRELFGWIQSGDKRLSSFPKSYLDKLRSVSLNDAYRVIENTRRLGFEVICYEDIRYPERLRNIQTPPPVLYVEGFDCLNQLDDYLTIGMVGTRTPSEYGLAAAQKLAGELAAEGAVVVSGMARGIDSACQQAAIEMGGISIAVFGCGLDITYPPELASLRKAIVKRGAIISEFPLGTRPYGRNFPVRNRIIAGLSLGIVVVQAPAKSGSLITAQDAIEQGKDVFAVPHDIFANNAAGSFRLLSEGAIPASCAKDVIDYYKEQYPLKKLSVQPKTAQPSLKQPPRADLPKHLPQESFSCENLQGLSETAILVYRELMKSSMDADRLSQILEIPLPAIIGELTELELQGIVHIDAGGKYRLDKKKER